MMLQSKFRKLVTLEKSASAFAMKLERTSANIYRKNMTDICECTTNLVTLLSGSLRLLHVQSKKRRILKG